MTFDLHYYAWNEGTSNILDMTDEFYMNRNVKREMRFPPTIQHFSDFSPTVLDVQRTIGEPGDLRYFGLSPKKTRAKESSKYFGVRFRTDLKKWVAEIRVAEWKRVDKKVWLGTFDSEEGAARAVDAARKLLKCKKKRPFNIPSAELSAYTEMIPSDLKLTNLHDDSMFKSVTLFVKKKAQEYASSSPCGQVCISFEHQVQPYLSYCDRNLLQRISEPSQQEVTCLTSQHSVLHEFEHHNNPSCAVLAAFCSCDSFPSVNSFSPQSCVSDGHCSSLEASNEEQENLLQAYEDAFYCQGDGIHYGSDQQYFDSYSSSNSYAESQYEAKTTHGHILSEEQGICCSETMRNSGHSDLWDMFDKSMFDEPNHWSLHQTAMDLNSVDEMQPYVDIPVTNSTFLPLNQFTSSSVNTNTDSEFKNSLTTGTHSSLSSMEFSHAVC